VACSIAYIRSNFGWLPESIQVKRLETQGLPLQESMDIMKNVSEKFGLVKGRLVKVCPPSCRQFEKETLVFRHLQVGLENRDYGRGDPLR
jgi:hypothetical protein